MKRITWSLLILLIYAASGFAEVEYLGYCDDIYFKKPALRGDNERIVVVDIIRKFGVIFDKTDLKKKIRFGRPGQGPGEFGYIVNFFLDDRYIYVCSFSSISIFSLDGNFVKELKSKAKIQSASPVGENFVCHRTSPEYNDRKSTNMIVEFNLYDSLLSKKKPLLDTKMHAHVLPGRNGKNIIYWMGDSYQAEVYKDRIYIGTTSKGFHFSVFDSTGNKLYEINRDVPKIPLTGEAKRKLRKLLKMNYGDKWAEYSAKNQIQFPDILPAYKSFFVNDERIYVFSNSMDFKYDVTILDLKGNLLKKKVFSAFMLEEVISRKNYIIDGKLHRMSDINERWVFVAINIWDGGKDVQETKTK